MMLSDAAACSQWGTALRHLIFCNEPILVETNLPTELPDNNTPPFLNVIDQTNVTNPIESTPAATGNTEKSGRFGPILHL